MSDWKLSAEDARKITNEAPLRKLETAKKQIMQEIRTCAEKGHTFAIIYMEYYDVSCLEDWCNIYNWLLKLDYTVEDNSKHKLDPNFFVEW